MSDVIAGGFTRYDEHAVQQMNRNIELIRYRRFGDGLLLFELVNATSGQEVAEEARRRRPESIRQFPKLSVRSRVRCAISTKRRALFC